MNIGLEKKSLNLKGNLLTSDAKIKVHVTVFADVELWIVEANDKNENSRRHFFAHMKWVNGDAKQYKHTVASLSFNYFIVQFQ